MQYTEKELIKLLANVEREMTVHLTKAEENFRLAKSEDSTASSVDGTVLAKAEDDKSGEAKKDDKKEDKKPAPKAESEEAPAQEAASEEAPAEGEEVAAPAAEQASEAAAPAADGQVYDEEDLAQMAQMYSEMSFEELMAHHDAVKECLDAMSAQQAPAQDAAPEAPAPEAAAPAAAAPAPAEPAPFAKSEGSVETELMKSELIASQAKNEELKKSLDAVSEFLTKLVSKKAAPSAKAITAVETIAKSEVETTAKTLSKSEITAILSKRAADPTLSKSDRETINTYYGEGQVSTQKISHLLK